MPRRSPAFPACTSCFAVGDLVLPAHTLLAAQDQDPLTFSDGRLEFVWRNGESPKGLTCRPLGRDTDHGSPTIVDSYAWVYTWDAPQ